MKQKSYRLEDLKNVKICIGYVGENKHTQVRIDCSSAFAEYPGATPALAIRPPRGGIYPAVIDQDGDTIVWTVTNGDLLFKGDGELQFSFIQGEVIEKTFIGKFEVLRSIITTANAPDGVAEWLIRAVAAAAAAEAAARHQPMIGLDGYWYKWDSEAEEYVNTGTKAQGPQGEPGAPGDPTQLIDDVTPALNKTFSSSKVDDELTRVKSAIQNMETPVQNSSGFIDANDFAGIQGVKTNTLEVPYVGTDMLDSSAILSNGTISTGSSYNKYMVSPLIPVTGGTYGLKTSHGNYGLGDINSGSDYDNGFGFFASDGTTVVARPSHLTALGNDIYVIPVPSGAAYIRFCIAKTSATETSFNWALGFFNEWIFLPGADTSITDDFFVLGTPKPNGTIEKIRRSDGSYLEITDAKARNFKQVDLDSIVKVSDFLYTGQGYNVAGNNVGDLYTSGRTDNEQCSCQVITVEDDTTYYIYGISNPNSFCIYTALDKDGYIIQIDKSSSNYRTNPKVVNPPTNAAYLIVNYWGYDATKDFTKKLTKKNVEGISKKVYTPLDGKTILLLGDSILGNDRYCGVAQYLNFYTGATVINGAIGGTRLCGTTRGVSDYTPFDGENLVTAITTGVWTDQDASAGNIAGYVALQTLPALKAMDLNDVDIVIFNWMSNDLTSDTSAATFKNAFKNVVEMLLTANPKLRLLCATVEWFWTNDGGSDITTWTIGDGYDAADCSIEAAGAMHVPVIDMYRDSPISNLTKGIYLDSDKIHLNVEGNKLYAKLLSEKLRAMLI